MSTHRRRDPSDSGAPPAAPRRLTQELRELLGRADVRPITIEEVETTLRGRGMAVLAALLAAPFVLPVPLPLLSTPFGLLIAILGVRLAFGMRPWLPAALRRRQLERDTLAAITRAAERVIGPIERLLRPRHAFLFPAGLRMTAGLGITAAAAMLSLPLPFPGANAIPALGIVLLAAGLMERDAVVTLAGHAMVLVAVAYLYLWWDLVAKVLVRLLP